MTNKQIETRVEKLLSASEEDFSEAEEFVEEHSEDYDGDLEEFAFRTAVRQGLYDYISDHIDDVELNDEDCGCYSSYLYETDDDSIIELLMDNGAFKNVEDYDDCSFAMVTTTGCVQAFSTEFREEVLEKYLSKNNLTRQQVAAFLGKGENPDAGSFERNLAEDMKLLGVSAGEGDLKFTDFDEENGWQTLELLESLGYKCEFEGESWKLETVGVYYIE